MSCRSKKARCIRRCIQGLVASEWGHSANNRRARYYRLTRDGRRALGDATSSFDRLIAAIGRVMRPA
jgi:PadR family transcriptional regulator PadR